jgi:hypothetical protein
MPSLRKRVKSSPNNQKSRKSVRKSSRKSRKSVRKSRKNVRKSSYRFGAKVSDGVNIFDARDWQEEALRDFLMYRRHSSGLEDSLRDIRFEIKKGDQTYVVFFNEDRNGIYYHPAKEERITRLVPDKSRLTMIVSYDPATLGQSR